jgi:hypothetical protein
MNKTLLLKVADAIEANPEHFDMESFVDSCGTTACIAGWAWFLNQNKKDLKSFINQKDKNLGENKRYKTYKAEIEKATGLKFSSHLFDVLCFEDDWHKDFKKRFKKATSKKGKARIAAEYVRWFVKTDGGTND